MSTIARTQWRWVSAGVIALALLGLLYLGQRLNRGDQAPETNADAARPRRIISMAPSTTETLFALGLGDRVVGVTRYCDYPPEVAGIAKVGGYVDPSYEAIVSLRPDLVILLSSHRQAREELAKLGIDTLTVPHTGVGDVHEAIRLIGQACGAEEQADTLLRELAGRSQAVRRAVEGKNRPAVLLCIGRDTTSGQLSAIDIAGREDFYDAIITTAGGTNACQDEQVPYPHLSGEGIIRLDPDIIVDLVSRINPGQKTSQQIKEQWSPLQTVTAVREGRVFVIVGQHALRPGPRYVEFLEQLARLLHPDAFAAGASDE